MWCWCCQGQQEPRATCWCSLTLTVSVHTAGLSHCSTRFIETGLSTCVINSLLYDSTVDTKVVVLVQILLLTAKTLVWRTQKLCRLLQVSQMLCYLSLVIVSCHRWAVWRLLCDLSQVIVSCHRWAVWCLLPVTDKLCVAGMWRCSLVAGDDSERFQVVSWCDVMWTGVQSCHRSLTSLVTRRLNTSPALTWRGEVLTGNSTSGGTQFHSERLTDDAVTAAFHSGLSCKILFCLRQTHALLTLRRCRLRQTD